VTGLNTLNPQVSDVLGASGVGASRRRALGVTFA